MNTGVKIIGVYPVNIVSNLVNPVLLFSVRSVCSVVQNEVL
jgi:hypothetical protein